MNERGALQLGLELVRGLRARSIRCALGGALAFGLWGPTRATKDVDLNCFVPPERYEELLDALIALGCVAPHGQPWTSGAREEFLRRAREGEVAVAWKDGMRVDIFVPSIPFYAAAEATVREVPREGEMVPVLSPEALCVFKLLFFREKDLIDVRRIAAFQGAALDAAWVRRHLVDMLGEDNERVTAWDAIVRDHHSPSSPRPS